MTAYAHQGSRQQEPYAAQDEGLRLLRSGKGFVRRVPVLLHEAGDCTVPRGELLAAEPLAVVNVTTNESGAEPLKTTRVLASMTMAEMSGRALVLYRGSQLADAGPSVPSQPRLVACGVIQ